MQKQQKVPEQAQAATDGPLLQVQHRASMPVASVALAALAELRSRPTATGTLLSVLPFPRRTVRRRPRRDGGDRD